VIVPLIMSSMEEYFVTKLDTVIAVDQTDFLVPPRAIGGKLKDLKILESDGSEIDLVRLNLTDISNTDIGDISRLSGFYMRGNFVVLHPKNTHDGKSLRQYYFRRPNRLVPTDNAGKIVSINTGTNEVQLDNVPTTWDTSDTFDVIQGEPPFEARGEDQAITLVAGSVLTFSSLPATMAVGDYVAEAGESPIPQIPYEAFPLLTQRGAIKVLEALSPKAVQAAQQEYGNIHKTFLTLCQPRVDNAPKKLVSRHGIWKARGPVSWPN
jgi:hypothetical protein